MLQTVLDANKSEIRVMQNILSQLGSRKTNNMMIMLSGLLLDDGIVFFNISAAKGRTSSIFYRSGCFQGQPPNTIVSQFTVVRSIQII